MNAVVDIAAIRAEFPILTQTMRGKPLVYLDTAATALKPAAMFSQMKGYYDEYCANIHRGVYEYSERASTAYETVRDKVRSFFSLPDTMEVVFTSGTTDGINFLATALCSRISAGDEILLTEMEHHSNFLPWQELCKVTGAKLVFIPLTAEGGIAVEAALAQLSSRTRICAFTGMSNVTGYIPQLAPVISQAKQQGSVVIIDGAQLASHSPVDLSQLQVDAFVCSAHKLYGPTGLGVLGISTRLLEGFSPRHFGGGMVLRARKEGSTWANIPERFEGGTPHIAGAVGLGASLDFLQQIGMHDVWAHETALYHYFVSLLEQIDGITIFGNNDACTAVCSFVVEKVHAHDIGTLMDQCGVAVRTGHHCAQPLLEYFGVASTVRVSFGIYNTAEEVEFCIQALKKALTLLQ